LIAFGKRPEADASDKFVRGFPISLLAVQPVGFWRCCSDRGCTGADGAAVSLPPFVVVLLRVRGLTTAKCRSPGRGGEPHWLRAQRRCARPATNVCLQDSE
jgi:hypothetical protein